MWLPEAGADPMVSEIAFGYRQALDPSDLWTLPACLHALTTAIKDCRNAGKSDDLDPAVILLARHLGAVARDLGENDSLLRRVCMDRIADTRGKSADRKSTRLKSSH